MKGRKKDKKFEREIPLRKVERLKQGEVEKRERERQSHTDIRYTQARRECQIHGKSL